MWNGIDPPFKDKPEAEDRNKAGAKPKRYSYVCLHCLHRWGSNQPAKSGMKVCPKCKQEAHREQDANAGAKPKRYAYYCPECGRKWESSRSPRDGVTKKICQKCEEAPVVKQACSNDDAKPKKYAYNCPHCNYRWQSNSRPNSGKKMCPKCKQEARKETNGGAKPKKYTYNCLHCNHRWESNSRPNSGKKMCPECKQEARKEVNSSFVQQQSTPPKIPQPQGREATKPKPQSKLNEENERPRQNSQNQQSTQKKPGQKNDKTSGREQKKPPKPEEPPKRGKSSERRRRGKSEDRRGRGKSEDRRGRGKSENPPRARYPDERGFGEYLCQRCRGHWASAYSLEDFGQQCKTCKGPFIRPYKWRPLEKPGRGVFRCQCGQEWTSERSWWESAERCPGCRKKVCPHTMIELSSDDKQDERPPKPHKRSLCEKCVRGLYCDLQNTYESDLSRYNRYSRL